MPGQQQQRRDHPTILHALSGHVVYAVTAFGGFLGLGSETHTIPWEQLHYDTALHGYKTSIAEEQLRKAPEFSRGDESLLSGHERQQLSRYYMEPWRGLPHARSAHDPEAEGRLRRIPAIVRAPPV